MKDKKGQMSVFLFLIIVGLFFSLILIFVGGIITIKINNALDQNINIGQVNLRTLNADTFGIFATTYLDNADWWALSILFGMIFGLFLSAYFIRRTYPKMGLIFDIFIIIVAFIVSLYISASYSTILTALSGAGETFLEDYTPKASMFLLNLPIFIVIIGVIVMILFHSSIPQRREERYQQGGYLQGEY